VSPVYHLHPEFGLLCPSWRLRRKAWVTLAFLTFLAIVWALAVKVGHDPDTDGTLIIGQDEAARTDARTVHATQAATATLAETSAAPNATACGGDQSSNIGMKCSVNRARKLQRPRAANEAAIIAALPLGRTAVPEPASAAAPLNAEDAVNTNVATPAVADLTGPAASALKKVRKPIRRNGGHDLSREQRWRDDRWSAHAYALPNYRYLRSPYERSWSWSW
jgi:hypothetical protein